MEPAHTEPVRTERNDRLGRLGEAVTRRPKRVLLIGALVLVVAGVLAAGTLPQLQLARFETPGSPAVLAQEELAGLGSGPPNVTVLVTARDGDVDQADVAAAAGEVEAALDAEPGIEDVFSYWSSDDWEVLRSGDGSQALIVARAAGEATEARALVGELSAEWSGDRGPVTVAFGGQEEVFRQVSDEARRGFGLAEAIVLPGVFLLLVLVFRRVVPAALILALGVVTIIGSMGALRIVAALTDVSTFAANLVLVMAIALGVDYGLFIIARHAEGRAAGLSPARAAAEAVRGAGMTVLVSGAAVSASLLGLLLLPFPFLRSFAYAGVAVVLVASLGAVVVLPAVLALLGERLDLSRAALPTTPTGWFERVARRTMRRPVVYVALAGVFVLALGAPLLGLRVGPPDDRILPAETTSRQVQDAIRADFDSEVADSLFALPSSGGAWTAEQSASLAQAFSTVDGVAEVHGGGERYVDGASVGPSPETFAAPVVIVPTAERLDTDPYGLVTDVRTTADTWNADNGNADNGNAGAGQGARAVVGGYPAVLDDYRSALVERLPWVFLFVLVVSTLVLMVSVRSIVLPLKAAVLNLLSLSVLGGVLVWVFQDGNLSNLLGFTATGTLDLSIPILMFCVTFGLSMDYEVLLLSRILQEHDSGRRLEDAVARGLQLSAPLVTTAAGILALSFLVYLSSGVVYLKMVGLGMALVVLVDATLVRLVLLPASVKLLGKANWWAPRWLRAPEGRQGARPQVAPAPVREETTV
ncbi:MMPL family transporter [Promicromonospora sp. NPDC023805]|uniref:MMPL family transporter n=1 Tax=Promicromonospora sp. NPDC023805 TaxID=3154696 RepID=UPI003410F3B4